MPLQPDAAPLSLNGRACQVVRFRDDSGAVLTWPAIADRLVENAAFRDTWHDAWATPFDPMWKPVPIHPATHDVSFFAVLVPSRFPPADASAFRAHLDALGPDETVATFTNLGGDARLVVPADRGAYGHLAAFARAATPAEAQAFWQAVGRLAQQALAEDAAVWCNTHGHGVPWLHVRFDQTHKYAAFPPRGPIAPAALDVWRAHYASAFPDAPPH